MPRVYQGPRGSEHHMARLTEAQVVEMRERYADGETQAQLAQAYHITVSHVSNICRGWKWRHVGGPTTVKSVGRPRKILGQ